MKGSKTTQIEKSQAAAVLEKASQFDINKAIEAVTTTQLTAQSTLAKLQADIVSTNAIVQERQQVAALLDARIKERHQIDVTATTLDELQTMIRTTQEEWAIARQAHEASSLEAKADLLEQRRRDEEEYNYHLTAERNRAADAYKIQLEGRVRTQALEDQERERKFQMREMELKAREQELVNLRSAVAGFPDIQKKETAAAVAIATNSVSGQYKHEIALLTKDREAALRIAENEKASLTGACTHLQAQIKGLETRLEQANATQSAMATKVAEAMSGQAALAAVQKAREQDAQTQGRGGR